MANEIRIGLGVTGEHAATQALKKVEDAAEGAGDAIKDMGDQSIGAGKSSDKAGDSFKHTGDDAGFLNRKVVELSAAYKELVKQLDATGDMSLKKEIRSTGRELRAFERLAKEIAPPVEAAASQAGAEAGGSMVKALAEGFRDGSAALKGAMIPVLAAVALAAAPVIGATIGAAVLGGVGAGGLVGGIALAAQDPRVKNAAKQFGESAMKDITFTATPFVEPVIQGLAMGRDAVKKWAADLAPSFAQLATKVEPLAQGLIGLVDKAMPGLIKALDSAGPVLDVLAKELPDVGRAFGDFLADLDPEAAATAFKSILDTTEFLIEQTGKWVSLLSSAYTGARDLAQAMGLVDPDRVGKEFGKAAPEVKGFGDAAKDAEKEIKDLGDAIDKALGKTFGMEEAQDRAADAFANLAEQVKKQKEAHDKGAGSLIGNTQAARDNRDAMRDLADKYGDLIGKYAEAGISTEGLRKKFIDNAVAAGIARKEATKYADALFKIPAVVQTNFKFPGLAEGIHAARIAAALFGSIRAGVQAGSGEYLSGRASGGPVKAGQPYIVGEDGPELVTFGADGMVHDAAKTKQMLNQQAASAMSGGWSGPMQVEATARWVGPSGPAGDLAEALARFIRIDVKVRGGGSVQGAYGEN